MTEVNPTTSADPMQTAREIGKTQKMLREMVQKVEQGKIVKVCVPTIAHKLHLVNWLTRMGAGEYVRSGRIQFTVTL